MDKTIVEEIKKLKKQRNAIILAHNYQREEIQDIADFVGDSLELSKKATQVQCDVIVFCGVHFMAETAAILNPDKTVLLPEIEAGCPMADTVNIRELKEWIKKYPNSPVISYVNTTAEVKSLSYACCTSANAPQIVKAVPFDSIIFVPDKNLADWAKKQVPEKEIIPWNGFCPTHHMIKKDDVIRAKNIYPDALVVVHPECRPEVIELADHVASTSGMVRFAKSSQAKEFIIGTEIGLLYRLRKENPDKKFYPLKTNMICPNMKITTLESVLRALKENKYIIQVPEDIRLKAYEAVQRMFNLMS
ncbi:quinolinate synthase [Thermodesulfovibrio aggregans]|uniref:Quinolinate synthase n=1 Tax=Thermodesulfovibrio aggregans TaxID=86166 RepID=A0A0U9IAV2_9BACT|nr:quinolinate synthase NadA [Thermodesulfovibrio aggregans]GAQ95462.1 quinolinate synthase [Thermodesulfovibrio aggregans]